MVVHRSSWGNWIRSEAAITNSSLIGCTIESATDCGLWLLLIAHKLRAKVSQFFVSSWYWADFVDQPCTPCHILYTPLSTSEQSIPSCAVNSKGLVLITRKRFSSLFTLPEVGTDCSGVLRVRAKVACLGCLGVMTFQPRGIAGLCSSQKDRLASALNELTACVACSVGMQVGTSGHCCRDYAYETSGLRSHSVQGKRETSFCQQHPRQASRPHTCS